MNAPYTNRRDVLRYAVAGGALLISVPVAGCQRREQRDVAEVGANEILTQALAGPFVMIRSDGMVTISFPNPEMGQGVDTSLAMLLAEELEVDFANVQTVQMPLEIMRRDDGQFTWRHVPQGSGGSRGVG